MIGNAGWHNRSLGNLLSLARNGYAGRQVSEITEFPVSRIETISEGIVNMNKVGYCTSIPTSYLLKTGDMLFSNINSVKHIGKIAQIKSGIRLYHGMNLLILRPTEEVDKDFLFYRLVGEKLWFESMAAQAINQASINQETLNKLSFELPEEKAEQTKIAEILSTVDRAIEQTEALIAKQERIKTGLMQDLLTRGIDEHGNLRSESSHEFKDSPLGRIPSDWISKTIEELIAERILSGIQDGNHGELHPKSRDFVDEGIPFVMASDIANGYIDVAKAKKISVEQYRRLRIGFSEPEDVLLSHKASIGFVALVPEFLPAIMLTPQVTYYRIGQRDILDARYLLQFLRSPRFQHELKGLAKQSTRDYIGLLAQQKLHVTYPMRSIEQKQIYTLLDAQDIRMTDLLGLESKLRHLKTAIMHDLLTGQKRVTRLLKPEVSC